MVGWSTFSKNLIDKHLIYCHNYMLDRMHAVVTGHYLKGGSIQGIVSTTHYIQLTSACAGIVCIQCKGSVITPSCILKGFSKKGAGGV